MIGKILSYSAGSTSIDPHKYRVIDSQGAAIKMQRLVGLFPELIRFFADPTQSLVVDAYPASLGGMESMTRVITYLHPPTCTRALRLAASESLRAIFIAQPLAGADLLLQTLSGEMDWPEEMLWATGGYPLPASLQRSVEEWLAERGCRLSVLQAYGVAELDHTLMASMHRDDDTVPIYHVVDPELECIPDENDSTGKSRTIDEIRFRGVTHSNSDRLEWIDAGKPGTGFRIRGDSSLYEEGVLEWLENWQPIDWENHTGHCTFQGQTIRLQRRHRSFQNVSCRKEPLSLQAQAKLPDGVQCISMDHHEYMARHGMSWLQKPRWGLNVFKRLDGSMPRPREAAAA